MTEIAKVIRCVQRRWRCALTLAYSLAFVLTKSLQAQSSFVAAAGDTALLTAVVRAAAVDAGKLLVKADPRPLSSSADVFATMSGNIVAIPDSVRTLRTKAIRGLGIEPVDAVIHAQNETCAAPRVLPDIDSSGSIAKEYAGCPSKPYYVLAIGLARDGIEPLPGAQVYDRERGVAAIGYSAVRVIRTNLGPGGSVVLVSDYVMCRKGREWVVVKAVPLLWLE